MEEVPEVVPVGRRPGGKPTMTSGCIPKIPNLAGSPNPGTAPDQVFSVVDEQPQHASLSVEPSHRQIWLSDGGPGHSQGVIGSAFPRSRPASTFAGHESCRDSDHRLTGGEQVGLEPIKESRRQRRNEPTLQAPLMVTETRRRPP